MFNNRSKINKTKWRKLIEIHITKLVKNISENKKRISGRDKARIKY